jgi:cell wall-associated NlpC family hydrolase
MSPSIHRDIGNFNRLGGLIVNFRKKWMIFFLAAVLFVSIIPVATPASAATATVEVVYGVNFRDKPSTSGKIIRMLKKGETLQLLDIPNNYWYHVKDKNGVTGYVSSQSKYTKLEQTSAAPTSFNATVVSSVSFRKGPSTSDERIRYLQKGEKINIIQKVNNYWYKAVDAKGVTGYVSTSSQYISTTFNGNNTTTSPSQSGGATYKGLTRQEVANRVIAAGKKYLGTPYEYGSSRSDTSTFDCSDFVRQAFKDAIGLVLPGDSRSQGAYVKNVGKTTTDWRKLQPGDLMFFMDYKGTSASNYSGINKSSQRISHVGIYLGDGKILHTYSKESGGVRIDSIQGKHWEYRFLFGGPVF